MSDSNAINDLKCGICGKVCKNKQGYSLHINKCNENSQISLTCQYCHLKCSTIYNIQNHMETCKAYKRTLEEEKKQELEETKSKLEQETVTLLSSVVSYKTQLDEATLRIEKMEKRAKEEQQRHDNMINMIKEEQRLSHKEKETMVSRIKDLESLLQDQRELNKQLTKEKEFINSKMIQFAEKATEKGNTIYNGTVSQIQNNTLQLQHFDGSLFRDKIIPPSRMVHSISGLVDFLHKLGIGNCYRSVDRSRKAVMWIDQDGKEIRDSNCSQLREKLLTTMEADIRRQLEYQQKQLHELEAVNGESYTDHMVSLSENIGFCQQLLSRKAPLMKELQKELSSRAKNKNDTTMDVPRIVGHTKFGSKLEEKMFADIKQWIGLSFEAFGRWMALQLPEDIEIEGAVLYKDKKFIKVKNDEGGFDVFYTSEFSTLVRKLYNDAISSKAQTVYHPFLPSHPSLANSKWEEMVEWLQEPTEKQSEDLIKGILLQKMNR